MLLFRGEVEVSGPLGSSIFRGVKGGREGGLLQLEVDCSEAVVSLSEFLKCGSLALRSFLVGRFLQQWRREVIGESG